MTTRQKIENALLKALHTSDGVPMPDEALISAGVQMVFPHPPIAEVEAARNGLETDRFISGSDNRFTGRSWTLTEKGQHQAQQL